LWEKVKEGCEGYQLREGAVHHKALCGAEIDDIDDENLDPWDGNTEEAST
jgi:hypothetical protein